MMDGPRGQERAGRPILFALALAAAIGAAALAISGGFYVRILGFRVSSHGGLRPALFSVLFAIIAYRRMPVWQQGSVERQVTDGGRRLLPWIAPVAAVLVLGL